MATLDLVGVLEDGLPAGAGVPTNPRVALNLVRGQTTKLRVLVYSRSGALQTFTTSDTLTMTVKRRPQDGALLVKTVTWDADFGPGRFEVDIAATDFASIEPAGTGMRLMYDLWTNQSGAHNAVVPLSPLVVEAAAKPLP